jgi:AraC family transcriptional activator of pobA
MKTMKANEVLKVHRLDIETFAYSEEKAAYQDGDVVIYDDIRNLSQIYAVSDNSEPIVPEFNVVVYCMQGRLMLCVNGVQNVIERDQVAIYPSESKLSDYMLSPDFQCIILCFTTHILQESLRGHIHLWNKELYINKVNKIKLEETDGQLLKSYYDLLQCKIGHPSTMFYQRIMQSIVQALLFELCGRIAQDQVDKGEILNTSQGKNIFRQFLELLQATEVKKHNVEYYAAELNISPKYLSVVCKRETGKTASAWIQEYLLEDIRFYMSDSTMTVKEAANRTGFPNLSFFGRFVKQHFGHSPREYREKLLEKQAMDHLNTKQA